MKYWIKFTMEDLIDYQGKTLFLCWHHIWLKFSTNSSFVAFNPKFILTHSKTGDIISIILMFHSTLCWNHHKFISMHTIFMLSLNEFVNYSNNALFTNLQCNSSLCIKCLSFPRFLNWYLKIYLVLRNNFHLCFFTYNWNSSIVGNLFWNTYNSINYVLGYMNKKAYQLCQPLTKFYPTSCCQG